MDEEWLDILVSQCKEFGGCFEMIRKSVLKHLEAFDIGSIFFF